MIEAHEDERRIEEFAIEIPVEAAYRLLGYGRDGRGPRESVSKMFREELSEAQRLVHGRAIMAHSHGGLRGSTAIPGDLPLVMAVVTIGDRLEKRVRMLARRGATARAVVLDAIGSAAAEEVADKVNRLVCEMAAPTDYRPAARRSPGYGGWNLSEQSIIFDLLGPEDIGVRLSEEYMMHPRKSVSFIVPLEGGEWDGGSANRCRRCGERDCPYRDRPLELIL